MKQRVFFKVVTTSLRSLGLRNNPNILRYRVGKWVHAQPPPAIKKQDERGMFACPTPATARALQGYVWKEYRKKTRIYACLIGRIIKQTSCRIQTDEVKLLHRCA